MKNWTLVIHETMRTTLRRNAGGAGLCLTAAGLLGACSGAAVPGDEPIRETVQADSAPQATYYVDPVSGSDGTRVAPGNARGSHRSGRAALRHPALRPRFRYVRRIAGSRSCRRSW